MLARGYCGTWHCISCMRTLAVSAGRVVRPHLTSPLSARAMVAARGKAKANGGSKTATVAAQFPDDGRAGTRNLPGSQAMRALSDWAPNMDLRSWPVDNHFPRLFKHPPNYKNTLRRILPKSSLPFKIYSEFGGEQEQEQEQKREHQQEQRQEQSKSKIGSKSKSRSKGGSNSKSRSRRKRRSRSRNNSQRRSKSQSRSKSTAPQKWQ